jgi:hypothetical protein
MERVAIMALVEHFAAGMEPGDAAALPAAELYLVDLRSRLEPLPDDLAKVWTLSHSQPRTGSRSRAMIATSRASASWLRASWISPSSIGGVSFLGLSASWRQYDNMYYVK